MSESLRVIDAHVHFWDPSALQYAWLEQSPAPRRAFLPGDFESLSGGALDEVVFVEANCAPWQNILETELVDALAATEPRIVGTVAFVELRRDRVRRAALEQLARRTRVVGVRQNIQGHPSDFCRHPEFIRGVQDVGALGLAFDLCVTAEQIPLATELVRNCPDTRFVLDHCGKPSIRDDAYASWASDVARLADCPNVMCKVSGLLTEARSDQRDEDALFPYLWRVTSCFGAQRMVYGSDWPVVTTAGGEPLWRSLVDRFTADWPEADRRAFYGDNAIRLYGLHSPAHP